MSAADAFEEKIARLTEEGKDGAKENETRKAEKEALHEAIDQQLYQREGRMAEAVLQGDTAKLWGLITAAIESGFIHHLGLSREDAGKTRGRNVVKIKTMEPRSSNKANEGEEKDEPKAIDGENKKGR